MATSHASSWLGIDIGGTAVKVALLSGDECVWTARSFEYIRPDTQTLVAAVGQTLRQTPEVPIESVGLCLPGAYSATLDQIEVSVNVPGIIGVPLAKLIEGCGRADMATANRGVCSDAHAAAFDVFATRGLSGRLMGVSLGTGVGACVLDDGSPLRVSGQSSGHFGQIDVSLNVDGEAEPIAPDGGRGGLEGYIGLPALVRRYGESLYAQPSPLSIDAPPVRALMRALRIAHAIYRPQHVCLLGGVGVQLAALAPAMHAAVSTQLTSVARPDWSLSAGTDGFHAARGAARLARAASHK